MPKVIRGGIQHPTLTSTAASVKSAVFLNNKLSVEIERPPYVFMLPAGLNYYISLNGAKDYKIGKIIGGTLVRQGPFGAIVSCENNIIEICFKN